MAREIYTVNKEVEDKNGNYSRASGFPKTFDSNNYNGDEKLTEIRATGSFSSAWADICNGYNPADHPQMQTVTLTHVPGRVIDTKTLGEIEQEPVQN